MSFPFPHLSLLLAGLVDSTEGAHLPSPQHSDGQEAHCQRHHAHDDLPRVTGTELPVGAEEAPQSGLQWVTAGHGRHTDIPNTRRRGKEQYLKLRSYFYITPHTTSLSMIMHYHVPGTVFMVLR